MDAAASDVHGDGQEPRKRRRVEDEQPAPPTGAADGAAAAESSGGSSMGGFGAKMLAKMGYKAGTGLGAKGQGITAPIEASMKFDMKGLGMKLKGLEPRRITDHELEQVVVDQRPQWMQAVPDDAAPLQFSDAYVTEGKRSLSFADEKGFVGDDLLAELLAAKSMLDDVDRRSFLPARNRANPYELLKKEMFQNRAALKMANLDAMFGFMFSDTARSSDATAEPPIALDRRLEHPILFFADVAAGPGGFTEYLLWRTRWNAKGYGFTLKGDCDWKLGKFGIDSPKETFHLYYGPSRTGDLYLTDNLRALQELVHNDTDGEMLHFMMADGGFDVSGNENHQEILNKQLLLAQFVCSLALVRQGGHMLCKTFDLFTRFSIGLVYLMRRHFQKVCIVKPHTSRPANSERYIVCEGLCRPTGDVVRYLWSVNDRINELKQNGYRAGLDVLGIVPEEMFDDAFLEYMVTSNNQHAQKQTHALRKLHKFIQDRSLPSENQEEIRLECLSLWHLPSHGPTRFQQQHNGNPGEFFQTLLAGRELDPASVAGVRLQVSDISGAKAMMKQVQDWVCCPLSAVQHDSHILQLLLSVPRAGTFVKRPDEAKWSYVRNLVVPPGTLLVGEVVKETNANGRAFNSFQALDAAVIGFSDVRQKHYSVRKAALAKMVETVQRPHLCELPFGANPSERLWKLRLKSVLPLQRVRELLPLVKAQQLQAAGMQFEVHGLYFWPTHIHKREPGRAETRQVPFSLRNCLKERRGWLPARDDTVGITMRRLEDFASRYIKP